MEPSTEPTREKHLQLDNPVRSPTNPAFTNFTWQQSVGVVSRKCPPFTKSAKPSRHTFAIHPSQGLSRIVEYPEAVFGVGAKVASSGSRWGKVSLP